MTLTSSDDAITGPDAVTPAPAGPRVARRILSGATGGLVVLWGAATAAFFAQRALPGDLATAIVNIRTGQAQERTPEEVAPVIAQFGLDRPVLVQYVDELLGFVRGDLGTSYQQFRPVWDIIAEQLGATLVLTVVAIALSWVLMVAWVTLTAGRSSRVRAAGSALDTIAAAIPPYWLGILLLLVFALQLRWFPVMGGSSLHGLALPALTLAIPLAGFMGQAVRTEFERTLAQPFVLSARMRGASDLGIRLGHVLRHASVPAVTLTGWALGATISGAVIVETVFSRPGIGQTLVTAVARQDLPVVTGIVLLVALVYVVANILVDVVYILIDPRIRTS